MHVGLLLTNFHAVIKGNQITATHGIKQASIVGYVCGQVEVDMGILEL